MREPDDVLAGWQHRMEQQTSLTMELSRRMENTQTFAESSGGEVVVTVDSSGGLAQLQLNDQSMRMLPRDLAALILETSRRAQAKLAKQMVEVVEGLYGAESATAAFIGGTYTDRFPGQPGGDEQGDRR